MKIKLSFIFILLIHFEMFASKGVEIIWSNDNNLKVTRYVISNVSTDVTFLYTGFANTWFQVASSIYASDEAGTRHKVIMADGIDLDNQVWLGNDGSMSFTLHFDPLPKDTKLFDIIESEEPNAFRIFGIHKTGTKLRFPELEEFVNNAEVEEQLFVPDTAVVRVQIRDYDRHTMPSMMRLEYHNSQDLQNVYRLDKLSQFHANGSSDNSFLMDYPKWTFLSLDLRRNLPLYIRPGDTLTIQIDNYGQWNEKITYYNNSGRATYSALQEIPHNLFWQEFIYVQSAMSGAAFTERLQNLDATASEFFNYMSWKHKLSAWENHLLMNDFRLRREQACQLFRSQRQREINELRQKQDYKANDIDTDMFVSKQGVDWSDKSLMYCNHWQASLVPESSALRKFAERRQPKVVGNEDSERYPTYRVTNVRAQEFIDSITNHSDTRYTELLLTTPDQREWSMKYLERFIDVAADFEGPDIHFILVVSRGFDDQELEQYKFLLQQKCEMYVADIDVVYIDVEDMVNLQEALHEYVLPGNVTITNEGGVFYRPMHTNSDQSRLFLRELLKHERENATNR